MMNYLYIVFVAYVIGSIPFAYLFVKFMSKMDVRNEGSGNVGAMNSYEITGNKWIGYVVFLSDALKGLVAVLIAGLIASNDFLVISLAAIFVVLGHNYSLFLKLKGGRGLSTAFGAMILIDPLMILIWLAMWISGFYIIKKDILIGNFTAIIVSPIIYFILPETFIRYFIMIPAVSIILYKALYLLISLIFLLKHIEPIKEMLVKKKN